MGTRGFSLYNSGTVICAFTDTGVGAAEGTGAAALTVCVWETESSAGGAALQAAIRQQRISMGKMNFFIFSSLGTYLYRNAAVGKGRPGTGLLLRLT